MVFFDASAVVKWFLAEEERADEVDRLRSEERGAVSQLTEVELVSAFARRHREGSISAEMLQSLLATCAEELGSVVVLEMNQAVVGLARSLLLRHPLRAGDAIQLSSCLVLQEQLQQPVQFLAFDQRLSDAAVREGLGLALS
jgi:hypothetical protein